MPRRGKGGGLPVEDPTPQGTATHMKDNVRPLHEEPAHAPAPQPPPEPQIAPGDLGPITAPSNRPDEPITAGLDQRLLASQHAAMRPDPIQMPDAKILARALYAMFPLDDLERIL